MTNENAINILRHLIPPRTSKAAFDAFRQAIDMAIEALKEPKIIRCKDCKNWDTTWTNDFSPNYHYCPMVDGVRKEDWFCADAERRTE